MWRTNVRQPSNVFEQDHIFNDPVQKRLMLAVHGHAWTGSFGVWRNVTPMDRTGGTDAEVFGWVRHKNICGCIMLGNDKYCIIMHICHAYIHIYILTNTHTYIHIYIYRLSYNYISINLDTIFIQVFIFIVSHDSQKQKVYLILLSTIVKLMSWSF